MWTLLFILVATAAATEPPRRCEHVIHSECSLGKPPQGFPGNVQELEETCEFARGYFGCALGRLDECGETGHDQRFADSVREIHANLDRICNNDSLLYRGLADNIACFKSSYIIMFHCSGRGKFDYIEDYAEALSNEGVSNFGESEEDVSECLGELYMLSCATTNLNRMCGGIATDVFVEIFQGFDSPFKNCPAGMKDHFPAIARVVILEEEKEEELENALKKK